MYTSILLLSRNPGPLARDCFSRNNIDSTKRSWISCARGKRASVPGVEVYVGFGAGEWASVDVELNIDTARPSSIVGVRDSVDELVKSSPAVLESCLETSWRRERSYRAIGSL